MRRKIIPRGPKPVPLSVTGRQQKILQRIIRRNRTPYNLVIRAKIVLAGRQYGRRNQQIARDLKASGQTVSTWRGRWLDACPTLMAMEPEVDDEKLEQLILEVLTDRHLLPENHFTRNGFDRNGHG